MDRSENASWLDPVEGDVLAYFRVVFGLMGAYWAARMWQSGGIDAYYIEPAYHFHYFGFGWVNLFGETVTRFEFTILFAAGLLIALGLFYRFASLAFAVVFTHLFLADKCLYQNHYYLICLIAWLLVVIPAHRAYSLDRMIWPQLKKRCVRRWTIWLLRFQIGVPYFFGAIAKINGDWLQGEPMRTMLANRVDFPGVGPFFSQEWCVILFAGGGLLFDLLVVPGLLFKRTRILACCLACLFHLTNAWLFTIGVFPWFMLFALPLYFPPCCVRRLLRFGQPNGASSDKDSVSPPNSVSARLLAAFLTMYVLWQVLMPLRHFALPGNPNWTEEGHCFSWHMLVRGKRSALRLNVSDARTGRSGSADLRPFVTALQLGRVARDPRLIHELASLVSAEMHSLGFEEIQVHAVSLVSMNGRRPQYLVHPKVDLATNPPGWLAPAWIVPLQEPLRKDAWDQPLSTWEAAAIPVTEPNTPP